ncbi:MAG: oxygenase MpaB family protein [Flavitalea sp.]
MKPFVKEDSIVREIWGKSDTILFIFAGASAEFALNKAVDWLYFTGKLPSDPLGRLFSTVSYARKIVFSPETDALRAIDSLRKIHSSVENARGSSIPDWAYRDVLFMLIHYSIAAYELLERKLSEEEKQEVFNVFYRLGNRMNLKDLPLNYGEWLIAREIHLKNDLLKSKYTVDLFKQYKKHLGTMRFIVLIEAQKLVVPIIVKNQLHFSSFSFLTPVVPIYKISRIIKLDRLLKNILLPKAYKLQIEELNHIPKHNQLKCPFAQFKFHFKTNKLIPKESN